MGPNPDDYLAPGAADLENFVNREEGHDILVVDATASGYYSSFYIQPRAV